MRLLARILSWFRGPPLVLCAVCKRPLWSSMLTPAGLREQRRTGGTVIACVSDDGRCRAVKIEGYYDPEE